MASDNREPLTCRRFGRTRKGDKIMAIKATNKLVMDGNTYQWRKQIGESRWWKYDAAKKHWYMMFEDCYLERVLAGDKAFLDGWKACKKGCRLTVNGVVVWQSKTYGEARPVATVSYAGEDHCDALGNAVSAKRIPGSLDYV